MSERHDLDMSALRERLATTRGPGYWRSLEELAGDPAFGEFLHHEFPRLAPLWDQAVDRRSTLKLMAASMALAGLGACSRPPQDEIVPYVSQPEHAVPGKPRHYATAIPVTGYAHGVLATSHQGRPTKLEGNPDHPATLGALDAGTQAAVLSLYDPDRSQAVLHENRIATFGAFLNELAQRQERWDADGGRGLCVLTDTVTSPSVAARLEALAERWSSLRRFAHEPVDQTNARAGCEALLGRRLEPRYRLDRARVVLALDSDFMDAEPGFLRYARDLAAQRQPEADMARLYSIESTPTITGVAADHRLALPADRVEAAARQLARTLELDVPAPQAPVETAWMAALARDLRRHRGAAVVVPGAGQPPVVHTLAHAINHRLGAVGAGVVFQRPVAANDGAGGLPALAEAIDAGTVDDLVVLGANPVYTAPGELDFEARFRRVAWRAHWGEYADETARLCHWHVPAAHPLESWADLRAYDGTTSLVQPLIEPLHGGRTALQFLHALDRGVEAGARELLRDHWRDRSGGELDTGWRRWLRAGVVPDTAEPPVAADPRPDWRDRLPAPAEPGPELVLQLRPDPAILDGRHANNGWLQELPRPLTKLTWTNAALVAPALAERRDLREGDVVRLRLDGRELEVPVYVLPGHPEGAVTLHLGHGRRAAGRVGDGVGSDAYRLRIAAPAWYARGLDLAATGRHRSLATTQNHHAMEGRDLIRAADLERFREDPAFAQHHEPDESLYPEPWPLGEPAQRQWGMAIDLNACIGCNACVTACQAENNIPVVGEAEVERGREMHWIRIDRYFEGQPEAPRMVFQPVPCMHCENAPCEYVCPVGATQHSATGLNEMIYNRCVGTRYCSQNCPYKVRRFNWFDYTGPGAEHPADPAVHNPDVTVRSGGVMEKCTYCVQRIRRAEIEAGASDLPIPDGGVTTACQQACPTRAISFGDISDADSEVRRWKDSPRNYAMLAELNTRPRTTYLAAVRNPNPEIPDDTEGGA